MRPPGRRSALLRVFPAFIFGLCVVALLSGACPAGRCLFSKRETIIIIGAGAAGLAAAAALNTVADVLVLEAQERLGGRVHTNRSLGVPIELGAVWIHRAEGNVVSELARRFGCASEVTENKQLQLHDEDGTPMPTSLVSQVYAEFTRTIMPEFLRRRAQLPSAAHDVDMETLMRHLPSAARLSGVRQRCIFDFLLFRDIVQDHTADLRQTSAREYDTDMYGGKGKDEVLPGGYDCIVHGLSRGVEVRTGRAGEVERLRYGEARGVEAHLADGSVVRADRAIVTLPLGVLRVGIEAQAATVGIEAQAATVGIEAQAATVGIEAQAASVGIEAQAATGAANSSSTSSPSLSSSSAWPRGAVRFEPPLPPRWLLPLSKLGWGEALKVGLRFPSIFWAPTAHFLGKVGGGCTAYGSSRHMEFVNLAVYTGAPVLLMETERAWARTLAAMPDEQLLGVVMGELRRMYPGAPAPTATVVARLGENVFQRGAFTFMPPRETSELQRRLWQPLAAGRVFLAGEHTSVLHAGTVHGAVVSGRQAAAQVRAAMRGEPLVAAAERFHEQYRERLYRANYGDDHEDERWYFWGGLGGGGQDASSEGDDDDPEEEVWDRNP